MLRPVQAAGRGAWPQTTSKGLGRRVKGTEVGIQDLGIGVARQVLTEQQAKVALLGIYPYVQWTV